MPKEVKKDEKVIKKKTRVSVSNTLNQMIFEQKDMNLQAFRMVMFYLAKINPKRPDYTLIKVPLETYAEMLGVELNEQAIDASTELLLGYKLKTGMVDEGEYIVRNAKYNIFSVCRMLERKSDGKRMLEFKCTDDVKPLIFELQEQFTKFNVWNVLNLSNFQDIRMYMLLSQYKVAGVRTLTIEELKGHLGIEKGAYHEYKIFARDVLKKCQKALKERSDIRFEFKAVGRPAHSVYFEIFPNTDYKVLKYLADEKAKEKTSTVDTDTPEQLSFNESGEAKEELDKTIERDRRDEICFGFATPIFDEFTNEQLVELKNLAWDKADRERVAFHRQYCEPIEAQQRAVSEYIEKKILYCNAYCRPVPHRYNFIKKAVIGDWE